MMSPQQLKQKFPKHFTETVDPTNPRDYEIPAYLRKQQGQAPLTPQDVKAKDEKAKRDYQQRLGNELEEGTALQGQYGHSGKMTAVEGQGQDMMDRIRFLAGLAK